MISIGIDHDAGRVIQLPIPGDGGAHWTVGGSSGGGKTVFAHSVVAQLAHLPHTALAISDPAWMDYEQWSPRASSIALGREGATWLLDQLEAELQWRLREGRRLGVSRIVPSAATPRIVAVLDEVAMVTQASSGKNATHRLIDIAQVGRKVGIGLVVMTQSPKATVIPRLVLEQCPVRICFRTEEPEQTDAVLGTQRIPAHHLTRAGEAWVRLPSGGWGHVRTPWIDPERCARIARQTAHLTPTLPAERGWRRLYDPYEQQQQESA